MGLGGGDPTAEGATSPIKIMCNIFISFIGAGILGLPFAFKKSGLLEGIAVMMFVGYFAVRAMLLLIECKYTILKRYGLRDQSPLLKQSASLPDIKNNATKVKSSSDSDSDDDFLRASTSRPIPREDLTYGDVGLFAWGRRGKLIVDVALVVSQIGFCCAYLIFITENLASYFPSVHKEIWLFIILPFLYLLTLYRQLHKLAFFSLFAQFSNLFAFGVVFWFDFDHITHAKERLIVERVRGCLLWLSPTSWSMDGFPFFFAVAVYCYEGAGMILSLECSVAKSERHKFQSYFLTIIVLVTALYITFGASGYLSFGVDTHPIITLNLPHGEGGIDSAMIVKLSLSVALFFTYPVMMFPVTDLLEKSMFPMEHRSPQSLKTSRASTYFYENVLRLSLVVGTGLIVVCIPSFADLMALIGSTCCTMLAFILPAWFHYKLHYKTMSAWPLALDMALIVMGLLAAFLSTYDTLVRIYELPSGTGSVHDTTTAATELLSSTVASLVDGLNGTDVSRSSLSVTRNIPTFGDGSGRSGLMQNTTGNHHMAHVLQRLAKQKTGSGG